MSSDLRPSADDLRERLAARRLLERMGRLNELAEGWERESCRRLRESFAERYRRVIGVHPARREELREALGRVRDGGRMPVEDVLDALNGELR